MTSGTVTPLADLPAGFFHALIVSRFDALEPPEQTVLKAGTGGITVACTTIFVPFNSIEKKKLDPCHVLFF